MAAPVLLPYANLATKRAPHSGPLWCRRTGLAARSSLWHASHPAAPPEAAAGRRCEGDGDGRERPSAPPRRGHVVDPEIRRRWYDAERPAWPAPITTASYTCTVVQQRTGTGYADPRTGRVGSDGGQRLSVASSSSRASLCGLRIA